MNRSFIVLLGLTLFLGAGFGGSFIGGVIYGQTLEDDATELAPRLGTAGQFSSDGPGAVAGQRGQGRQGQAGGFAGGQVPGSQGQAPQSTSPGNLSGREGRRGPAGAAAAAAAEEQVGGADNTAEAQADQGEPAGTEPAAATGTGRSNAQTNSATGSATGRDGSPPVSGRGGVEGTVLSLEGDTLTVASARGELTAALSDATTVYQISESSRDSLTSETRVRVIGNRNPEGRLAAQSVIIMPAGTEDLFGAAGGPGGRRRGGGS